MAEHPDSLTEDPNPSRDLLSELLRGVRLSGALYYRVHAAEPWPPIRVPPGGALTAAFDGRTRTVMSFHALVEGSAWTGLSDEDAVQLRPGDVVVYPRGDAYYLACNPKPGAADGRAGQLVGLLRSVASGSAPPTFDFGSGEKPTTFVCGFLGCDPRPFDPLLGALPPMLVGRAEGRLARLVALALEDVDGGSVSDPVRQRLSESMFIEAVRGFVVSHPDRTGWLSGGDSLVGRTLVLMHESPGQPRTLASLAAEVGTSRTALAERFTRVVGRPPMAYLTDLRLRLAARLLSDTPSTVGAVAHQVGFGSDASFSRAFKRTMGSSPSEWRTSAG